MSATVLSFWVGRLRWAPALDRIVGGLKGASSAQQALTQQRRNAAAGQNGRFAGRAGALRHPVW